MTGYVLAIDLGGTKIEAALVDAGGGVWAASRTRRPTGRDLTADELRAAVVAVVADALAALPSTAQLVAAGIGTAGPIDNTRGTIAPLNMPGVHGVHLADVVGDAIRTHGQDVPVVLGHDGACLALAESWIGATSSARASLAIVVSTGIGGGITIGGQPVGGAAGNAGHIGQMHVDNLTVEEVASGPASIAWAQAQGWEGATGPDLAKDAAAGVAVARAAIERSAAAVGRVLADAATLLNLDVIAISGGFSRVSEDYVDLVAASVRSSAALDFAREVPVVRSGLADEGPLIGAAALAWKS